MEGRQWGRTLLILRHESHPELLSSASYDPVDSRNRIQWVVSPCYQVANPPREGVLRCYLKLDLKVVHFVMVNEIVPQKLALGRVQRREGEM